MSSIESKLSFIKAATELIDSAKKGITIITDNQNELSDYNLLTYSIQSALDRGVKIKFYARGGNQDVINKLLYKGCEVYLLPEKTSKIK